MIALLLAVTVVSTPDLIIEDGGGRTEQALIATAQAHERVARWEQAHARRAASVRTWKRRAVVASLGDSLTTEIALRACPAAREANPLGQSTAKRIGLRVATHVASELIARALGNDAGPLLKLKTGVHTVGVASAIYACSR